MKVLIGTDLSQGSQSVIDAVSKRRWRAGCEVCVLRVVDLAPYHCRRSVYREAALARRNPG